MPWSRNLKPKKEMDKKIWSSKSWWTQDNKIEEKYKIISEMNIQLKVPRE